ncbi:SusC/RagA family TonB-linked outer membrane protein [Sphingobacterium paucimobilis]|uniref:TonB-dependent receptor plug domain-containing protein n=1 Tax=Sphingobacterium paucimobilis HER1398 TaxID=1346330 RepID=U2HX92_9SPHI|nr:SusC/RagA family TonB-linked outer membrane protein [Sphingobacterium paucimobilis]ERJ59895.1 hypothetical protein M472_14075 [Sphingobacterium paucimobilis HER1398]
MKIPLEKERFAFILKIWLIMKVLLLFFLTSLQASIVTYGQNITLTLKNTTVEKALSEISKQAGVDLAYDSGLFKKMNPINVNVKNVTVNQALTAVIDHDLFEYELKKNTLVVRDKATKRTVAAENTPMGKQQSVRGRVTDEAGKGLGNVTVKIKGKPTTTTTDGQGNYSFSKLAGGDILVFSILGYQSQEVNPRDRAEVNIVMKEETSGLDEVVVTGYQKIDKRTFTGSVGKVKPDELATASSGDVGKALQGMVAGVAVENTSGTFGTKSKIRIRGNSSISGNQEPLWVVDGVVLDDPVNVNPNQLYSGDAATMLSSAISGINPDDIEDIQILKDASATAMYGTQAVNGVIVVTTKKGKVGKAAVSYKNNFSLAMKPSIRSFNVLNSKERMEFSEELYDKNLVDFINVNATYGAYGKLQDQLSRKQITWDEFDDEIERAKSYNTDWFKSLFNNSLTHEHSASVSTGTDRAQFYMSGSYFRDNGQTRNQYTDRYSGNFKGNVNISDNFSITGTLYGSARNQRLFGAFNETEVGSLPQRDFDINPYTYARTTSRAMRPYDDDGNLEFYRANFAPFNILHEMDNNFVDVSLKEIKFQLDALWKITNNLHYASIISVRTTTAQSEHITTEQSNVAQSYRAMDPSIRNSNGKLYDDPFDDNQFKISVLPRGGILILDNNRGEFYTVRNTINYKPVFQNHSFDLMGGSELRQRKYNKHGFTGYGLEYNRGMTSSSDYRAIQRDQFGGKQYYGVGVNLHREASFFANLAYTYKNRYSMTLSSRADGSNRLGTSERFRFLPIWVVGASWNIDDEPFMRDIEILDYLKLRGSYGTRGNISGLGSPELLAYYGTTLQSNLDNIEELISITSPDNPFMQWEKEKMTNAALEFSVFKRASVTLEWYHRKNYDLIANVQVSRVSGFGTKTMNWADMKNEGFEITLNTKNVDNSNFKWSSIFTFGYNYNEVTRLQTNAAVVRQTVSQGAPLEGRPVSGLYSFRFASLNEEGLPLFYLANGGVSTSFSRYSTNLDILQYEGSREPLGSGGFTNQFHYKGFQASFLFTYGYGNKIRLNPFFASYYSDVMALDGELANRWSTPGDELYTNIPRIVDKETRAELLTASAEPFMSYNRSDIRVASGSYVRFKNIMLAYTLPSVLTKRFNLDKVQLTGQAQNLALWADPKLRGQDPEAIVSGISMPVATNYTLGLSLTF